VASDDAAIGNANGKLGSGSFGVGNFERWKLLYLYRCGKSEQGVDGRDGCGAVGVWKNGHGDSSGWRLHCLADHGRSTECEPDVYWDGDRARADTAEPGGEYFFRSSEWKRGSAWISIDNGKRYSSAEPEHDWNSDWAEHSVSAAERDYGYDSGSW
jgi:hypothetical protein